jgi:hypothetical protein
MDAPRLHGCPRCPCAESSTPTAHRQPAHNGWLARACGAACSPSHSHDLWLGASHVFCLRSTLWSREPPLCCGGPGATAESEVCVALFLLLLLFAFFQWCSLLRGFRCRYLLLFLVLSRLVLSSLCAGRLSCQAAVDATAFPLPTTYPKARTTICP